MAHELVLRRPETPATREGIVRNMTQKKEATNLLFFYKFLKRLLHYNLQCSAVAELHDVQALLLAVDTLSGCIVACHLNSIVC